MKRTRISQNCNSCERPLLPHTILTTTYSHHNLSIWTEGKGHAPDAIGCIE